jgi:hypothetical protein
MHPCPKDGKNHREKPTRCVLEAVDLHNLICASMRKHAKKCFLENMIKFVPTLNAKGWKNYRG